MIILIIDNYDSFTYNLVDYVRQCGVLCDVLKNDDERLLDISLMNYNKVLLSPGPGTPSEAGYLMKFLRKHQEEVPILGVCLGHQALGIQFGFALEKAIKPMHGKVSEVKHRRTGLFKDLKNPIEVCRYHSLVLKGESEKMEVTAKTADGEVMAIKHKHLPLEGVQFHPEAILTNQGLQMINNWLAE